MGMTMKTSFHQVYLFNTVLYTFIWLTLIKQTATQPCTVCKEEYTVTLPDKSLAIPGFPGEYTCAQLELFLPSLIPNNTDPNCQLIQSVGSICGCPMPAPSCSLCQDTMAHPERTVDFLSDLFGGFVPTCELLDAFLRSIPPEDTLCSVGRQYLSDYCGCDGKDLNIFERPCSVCSDGSSVSLPSQELGIEGVPFQTCKQLEEAARMLFAVDSQECTIFQSISSICGCPPVQANPCSTCPDGGNITFPNKPVRFVKEAFGGLVPSCEIFDAFTASVASDSEECGLIQQLSGFCGCAPISDTHCRICDEPLKPDFEQTVLPDAVIKYLEVPEDLGFDITCELAIGLQFQVEATSATCTTARSRRELCGCDQGEYYYLEANKPWHKPLLAWLPRVSGILSLLGASGIIAHVLHDKKSRSQTYNQLVASMSVFDVIGSIAWIFSTAANDVSDIFPIYGEAGNESTCTAQGFFLQLAVTSIMYNTSLSGYYFITIVLGWRGTRLKRTSKYLQAVPSIIGFVLAFAGIPFYMTNLIVCHLAPPPLADSWAPLTWLLFVPVWTVLVICTILSFSVWWKVHKQATIASKWRFRSGTTLFQGRKPAVSSGIASTRGLEEESPSQNVSTTQNMSSNTPLSAKSSGGGSSGLELTDGSRIQAEGQETRKRSRRLSIEAFFKKGPPASKMKRLEREVMWQALSYLSAMYICWTIFVSLFYKRNVYNQSFILYCVGSFLMPLQGFLNCLNYFRPRMARLIRKRRRERRRLPQREGRANLLLGILGRMVKRSSGLDGSSSDNPLDAHVLSSVGNDSAIPSAPSNITISSAEAITLEVDKIVEPSAYFCEYEDKNALQLARQNIAEELDEMDRAEGLIEEYQGQ